MGWLSYSSSRIRWSRLSSQVAFDLLSTLTAPEISVTGTVTATISRFHVCTGTSADYTITLPAASGNADALIGFRFGPTLTQLSKFVTLDGNGSETIDGALTRLCWAGESVILICDGSNWFKIAGNSLPMECAINNPTAAQTIANNTETQANLTTIVYDNTGSMANVANNRIVIKRAGIYRLVGSGSYWPIVQQNSLSYVAVAIAGAKIAPLTAGNAFGANFWAGLTVVEPYSLAVGDLVTLRTAQFCGTSSDFNIDLTAKLSAVEIPQW